MQASGLYRFKKQEDSIEDPVNPLSLQVAKTSLKTVCSVAAFSVSTESASSYVNCSSLLSAFPLLISA